VVVLGVGSLRGIRLSLHEFLEHRNFSRGAIEYYAVMNFVEADMNNAVMEVLREDLEGTYVDMQTIDGGMDRLRHRSS
jgi:hypothetical protein